MAEAEEKFGFLLEAFQVRRTAPAASPSAGTASSPCSRSDLIRDVIAFPKSGGGFDPTRSTCADHGRAAQGGGVDAPAPEENGQEPDPADARDTLRSRLDNRTRRDQIVTR